MSDLKETTFIWTVENFDVAPHLTGEWIESPVFSIDAMKKSRFSLIMYPRGWKMDENWVSLFVKRHNDDAGKIILDFELSLVDASGKRIDMQRASEDESPKNIMRGNYRFCDRNLLLSKRSLFLPDGGLTVACRMLPVVREERERDLFVDGLPDIQLLSLDFGKLLKSGSCSDLTIEAEGKEFKVHKVVLEARCPELMSHLVRLENSNVMTLKSLNAPVLQAILHYLYTGIFEHPDTLKEVLVAANRYALADLKTLMFPYSFSFRAKTVVECFQVSFEWIIIDYKNFPHSNNEHSYSLISDDIPKSAWMKLSLFTKERDADQKSTFLKFQKLWNYYYGVVYFKVEASDQNGKLILLKESENMLKNGKFEIPFDIGKDSAQMLVNGNLKLRFDIRTSIESEQVPVEKITLINLQMHTPHVNTDWRSFQKDLLLFYKTMEMGDVTLCIGPRKMSAHKAVLCSRSEVFCKMFEHDSLEGQTNSVNIKDVDEETMTSILMYMYCGVTDDDMDVSKAVKLYTTADKYQLLLLKERCCQYLKSNIDAENVGDVLLLADAHFDGGLVKCVHKFITANASEILQSQRGLKVLEGRVDLYQDILNTLLQYVSLQNKAMERQTESN